MSKRLEGKLVVVTLHPAIDRTIEVPRLRAGGVLPGRTTLIEPAGKGMNITGTLSTLGNHVVICGLLGRRDAEFFQQALHPKRVRACFVLADTETRCNITLVDTSRGTDTHITEKMRVSRKDIDRFLDTLGCTVKRGDWVVFTGSSPDGLRVADFSRALRLCQRRGAHVCVDTSGPQLRAGLQARPLIIKPNREELEELTGKTLRSQTRVLQAARLLLEQCEQILVSLGAEGALLIRPEGAWVAKDSRKARTVHTVGCGDALLAGYLSAYARGASPGDSLRFGVACGSACVRTHSAIVNSRAKALACKPHVALRRI